MDRGFARRGICTQLTPSPPMRSQPDSRAKRSFLGCTPAPRFPIFARACIASVTAQPACCGPGAPGQPFRASRSVGRVRRARQAAPPRPSRAPRVPVAPRAVFASTTRPRPPQGTARGRRTAVLPQLHGGRGTRVSTLARSPSVIPPSCLAFSTRSATLLPDKPSRPRRRSGATGTASR